MLVVTTSLLATSPVIATECNFQNIYPAKASYPKILQVPDLYTPDYMSGAIGSSVRQAKMYQSIMRKDVKVTIR